VIIGWVASDSAVRVDAFLPAPFLVEAAAGSAAAFVFLGGGTASDADAPDVDVPDEVVDLAVAGAVRSSLAGTTLDDTRTAGGGSSSPDGPDESLKNF
jgi:hypothetical protein